jgi:hypothetical protein
MAIDPNTIAFIPPETLSRQQNRYVEQGEYHVITVEHVAGPEGTAGYDVSVIGELVHLHAVVNRDTPEPTLISEEFVPYTGPADAYVSHVETEPNATPTPEPAPAPTPEAPAP